MIKKAEKFITEPERKTPVIETDVFVAGAGTAGCIAALAAKRAGANVVLVEKQPVPGGTLGNGGIGWNGFYAQDEDPEKARRIVGGIAYELAKRLEEKGGSTGFLEQKKSHYRMPYRYVGDHEPLKGILSEMLLEEGITVYLQTMFCGVLVDDKRITAALIENKDGRSAVVAKNYIDCTGDGDLSKSAGLNRIPLWQDYDKVCGGPTGMVFGMNGIDFDEVLENNGRNAVLLDRQINANGDEVLRMAFAHKGADGKYAPLEALDINYFTNFQSNHKGEATYINNSKGVKCDASDAKTLSDAELELRVRIMNMAKAFRDCVPGFEKSYISWSSPQIGIRATWITECEYMITQEDITEAKRFDDEIGLYAFHDLAPKNEEYFSKAPGYYGFPYRMLIAKGCENLLMAGRCVTMDINAHMSTRNTVGCMIMGQGAGVAAALSAKKNVSLSALPYKALKEKLVEQNVIL